MKKVQKLAAMAALGALAVLPGCSLFHHEEQPVVTAPPPAPAPAPAPAPPPPNPSANEQDRSLVRKVQLELKHHHMYPIRIDGVWGRVTERGVRRFQRADGLPVTGELDDATLNAMNLAAPAAPQGGMNEGAPQGGMNEGAPMGAMPPPAGAPAPAVPAPAEPAPAQE